MHERVYALFVDVMGVQQLLLRDDDEHENDVRSLVLCRDQMESFHRDLSETVGRDLEFQSATNRISPPLFVAEFSDAAYIASESFRTVAAAGFLMMRRALQHEYPLRGGIGFGSLSHETSGVTTKRGGEVWSTSSFFGSAVVTAYQAERSPALGLRVFVHARAMREDEFTRSVTIPLSRDEISGTSAYEVRLWSKSEAPAAMRRLITFRDKQKLSNRAREHYDSTIAAYERCSASEDTPLPFLAMWR